MGTFLWLAGEQRNLYHRWHPCLENGGSGEVESVKRFQ